MECNEQCKYYSEKDDSCIYMFMGNGNPKYAPCYTELIIECKECPAGMEIWVDSDKEKDVEDAKKELFTAWNTRIEWNV